MIEKYLLLDYQTIRENYRRWIPKYLQEIITIKTTFQVAENEKKHVK